MYTPFWLLSVLVLAAAGTGYLLSARMTRGEKTKSRKAEGWHPGGNPSLERDEHLEKVANMIVPLQRGLIAVRETIPVLVEQLKDASSKVEGSAIDLVAQFTGLTDDISKSMETTAKVLQGVEGKLSGPMKGAIRNLQPATARKKVFSGMRRWSGA